MSESNDYDYFNRRAAIERKLCLEAPNPTAAAAHRKLARSYERLAGRVCPVHMSMHANGTDRY